LFKQLICTVTATVLDQVHQDPPELFCMTEDKPRINCKHEIQDYNRILWYKQSKDHRMQFLGYMNVKDSYPENGVKVTITGKATKGETCTLTLEGVDLSSSGVYFCAASHHSAACHCFSVQKPPNRFGSSDAKSLLIIAATLFLPNQTC
uniref:Ig-like domain-containing protein n=1 Tax=Cyprinodon variegatus TaxID=28743 RepID=A0A3Q2D5Y9_CYPVA